MSPESCDLKRRVAAARANLSDFCWRRALVFALKITFCAARRRTFLLSTIDGALLEPAAAAAAATTAAAARAAPRSTAEIVASDGLKLLETSLRLL